MVICLAEMNGVCVCVCVCVCVHVCVQMAGEDFKGFTDCYN